VFVDGTFGGDYGSQSPEISPGDLDLFEAQLFVGLLELNGEVLEAHVVDLVEVDAPVAATNATVESCKEIKNKFFDFFIF